jgi:organic hydroperoxide reductase OsmC/OhrA
VNAGDGRLHAEARGEIVEDDGVLVIRRIEVTYHLRAPAEKRSVIERVLDVHADHCPVARTLRGCVEIATGLELEEEG